MRAFLLAALVSCLAPSIHADTHRQLVVALRSGLPVALHSTAEDRVLARRLGERLGARCDSLGLRWAASLDAGLLAVSGAVSAPRSRSRRPSPFGLDPARVVLLEARDAAAAAAALALLTSDPEVEWVEPNRSREAAVVSLDATSLRSIAARAPGRTGEPRQDFPSDPFFRDLRQWGLLNPGGADAIAGADIAALGAWRRSTGSLDVRLAIADTGIDPAHPELNVLTSRGMRIEQGVNVTAERSLSFADSFGHGTPVAGVMAARTNEGPHFDSLGIAGVCGGDGAENPGCRIVPIKIAPGHSGGASSFDIARAILHATRAGARAMNLSFAGASPSRLERLALYDAITHGCVVVAASGNRGDTRPGRLEYPAAYAADGLCIAVGASDAADRRAAFSSFGPGLDLVAPGVDIWTTYMTYPSAMGVARNGYVRGSGTSFAAPFVTGTIGLLAAARPELADADFRHVLTESAEDVGPPGPDLETGAGRLDAARALESVDRAHGIWHDEVPAQRFARGVVDSLVVLESGPGSMAARVWPATARVEAIATVAIPDSFLDPVRVWPRVAGTMTVRGDFRLPYFAPWAELISHGPDSFTLRGFLYEPEACDTCTTAESLPLPLDQARFGFTVIGRVDRAPTLDVLAPAPATTVAAGDSLVVSWSAADPDEVTWIDLSLEGGKTPLGLGRVRGTSSSAVARIPCPSPVIGEAALRVVALDEHGRRRDRTSVAVPIRIATAPCDTAKAGPPALGLAPNPFRSSVRVTGPAGARVAVIDLAGRVVRRARLDGRLGTFVWDGRDQTGRALGPGLYLVQCDGSHGRTRAKVLKLE